MKSVAVSLLHTLLFILLLSSCAGVPNGRTTAMHDAADTGDLRVIEELISEDSNVDAMDKDGRTALHHAAIAGNVLVTAALLNAGADPDLQDKSGRVPLHYAVLSCNTDLVAMLLAADADPFTADKNKETPMNLAENIACEEVEQTINSSL